MKRIGRRLGTVIVATLAVAGVGGLALGMAWATPGQGLTITDIVRGTRLEAVDVRGESDINEVELKTRGSSDVYVAHIRILPGGQGGWHSHPGPSILSVTSGEATFYHADDPNRTPHVFSAGTSFAEDSGHVHNVVNEGDTDLELVVLQLVPAGAPRRINEPQPPHYDF